MPEVLSLFPDEEEKEGKFMRKLKEDPTFPVATTVFAGIVGYGLYGLKTRKIPLSLYLIHLRVAAQGLCIGCLSLGMAYQLGKRIHRMYWTPAENPNTN